MTVIERSPQVKGEIGCMLNLVLGGAMLLSIVPVALALLLFTRHWQIIDGIDALFLTGFYALGWIMLGQGVHQIADFWFIRMR